MSDKMIEYIDPTDEIPTADFVLKPESRKRTVDPNVTGATPTVAVDRVAPG